MKLSKLLCLVFMNLVLGLYAVDLNTALDDESLTITTGGDAGWFGQTEETYDGLDAAQSGDLDYGEQSWMSTTVTGPVEIAFYWRMITDGGEMNDNSVLSFFVDGELVNYLDYYSDEFEEFTCVYRGTNEVALTWLYQHNAMFTGGGEQGWVDELVLTPALDLPPYIYEQPEMTAVLSNSTAILSVASYGADLSYQWYEGESGDTNAPVSGATGPSLTTLPVTKDSVFWVRITNSFGTDDSDSANVVVYHEVYTVADLQKVGSGVNGWDEEDAYILMNSIDCSALSPESPYVISSISGLFNGNECILSNLFVFADGNSGGGLFSVNYGEIRNLGLSRFCVTNAGSHTGGVCAENYGSIRECFVDGDIYATGGEGGDYIGLICGQSYGPNHEPGPGVVEDCYSCGSIEFEGCYYVGGLVGHNGGIVNRCYSIAKINDLGWSDDFGAFIGREGGNSEVTDCYCSYWGGYSGSAIGLFQDELTNAVNFAGFDFVGSSLDGDSDFWSIETGHCPKLSWQSGPGPVTDASGPDTTLSGEGSPNNPFVISSLADFYEFSDNEELSIGYYRLDVDIDLSGTNFTCAVVNREFSGVFDGNGHVVANMFIDVDCSDSVGLFMLNSGTLYELGVESYCISNALESVGGLCGINSGLISGCFASGDIYGAAEEECYNIGGLCGKNRGSSGGGFIEFDNVAFSEEVDGASAFPEFGGLVVIEDSYSGGAVYLDGAEAVGGLVGYNDAEIYRSYSITEVDVSENSQGVGAFVGEEEFSSYVEDCYVYSWAGSPGSAIALTSPEMEDAYSYGGFDFVGSSLDGSNDVWDIVFGFCPKLEWQSGNGLPVPDYVPETTLSGDGTSTSPFVIASLSDFYEFAENSELSAGYYQLDVDVDLSGTNYSTAVIDREFNGVFDGNTHTISDLLIDADGGSNVGLFKINGGTILDLGLEGFCISNVYRYAGAICGENYGRISRCFVNGDLYGDSFSSCYSVGALCGENYGSSAGYSPGIIEDCFAAGSVYIYDGNAGGFAGSLDGICRRCYTITKVKDLSGPAKAFSGSEFEDSCVVENCYAYFWSGDPASATALFSNELTQASSFDGFDFSDSSLDGTNDLWSISAGHCPKLVWQSGDGFAPPSFGANTTLSGDGSPLSPFVIGTLSDFYEFIGNSELSRGSYRLDLDLDLSGTNFTATVVDREFWGVFDGNGHVVSNLTINSTGDYLGFFSWNHGVVRDLGIENITIGGGVDNDTLGGICAINSEGVISNCYVNASLAGDDYIGAICGRNFGGIIAQCYAFGNIAGTDYVGGICGLNNFGGEISQCYSMATVSGESYYGGVCGSGSGVATNTYFYFMTSADNGIGTALYRDELLMSSSFSGFDFAGTSADGTADIWDITAGHPPKLNWQSGAVPAAPELPALAGNGSASDPFVISNLSDFHAFSTNALYSQGHYLLAVSLDLSGDSYNASVVNRSFGGCFDGGGHSISNLVINTGGSSTDYLGLFSYLTGTVKNLGVEAVSITGNSYSDFCGGVCGYSFGGVVSNCYVTGSVSANNYLGGLCGQCEDGTVYKSYADVDVAGDDYLGGLVGQTYDSSAYECYAAGDVNGEDYCGGFSGYHVSGTINNCYASGDVSGLEHVAGFCPNNYGGTISRCFAGGVVTGESELGGFCEYSSEFLIQDCYFYILGGPDVGFGSPLSSAQLQLAASFAGFDFAGDPSDGIEDIWAITAGYMPRLSWQPDEGVLPPPAVSMSGSGSPSDPFLIENMDDFNDFATNAVYTYGCYQLQSSLDFNGVTSEVSVVDRNFAGCFNGNGCILSNIVIDTQGANTDYLGLFRQSVGTVRNLSVANISITGTAQSDYCGGIAGYIENAVVSNCTVTGFIDAGDYLGSICGKSAYSTIVQCDCACDMDGTYYLGGVCGYLYYGSLSTSRGTGPVDGSRYLGGVCGRLYNAAVENCYATGSVNGSSLYVGGFLGSGNGGSVKYCYSVGQVAGSGSVGGLTGIHYSSFYTSCYWDTVTSQQSSSNEGYGRTTEQMQTQSNFTGWNFSAIWQMNGYPELVCFATAPASGFGSWCITQGIPPGERGDGDDPMGDGIPNLLKYACGLTAMQSYSSADLMYIDPAAAADTFSIRYQKDKNITDVTLEPIQAASLAGPWVTTGITDSLVSEDSQLEYRKASIPMTTGGFMRLRATRNP